MLLVFVPWARLVSTVLDKDARQFHLSHHLFNAIYMAAAVVALVTMLFVPIFWIGWPLGMAILITPVYVYWQIRNREVPEKERFELTTLSLSARLAARKKIKSASAAISWVDPAGNPKVCPPKDDPRFSIHMLGEDLLVPALEARATEVNLAVSSRGTSVSQTIDGIRYKREAVPAESAVPLIDYMKDVAGLNVEDRRRRQTATVKLNGP